MEKLLLLEDDIGLIDGLQYSLEKNGFSLAVVRTVKEAKAALAQENDYDLLLLDVTLPDGTGFEVCEAVRKRGSQIPIIFLTAADEETNIIRGLDGGGDDYITKPFRLGELCSRIRALLRRSRIRAEAPEKMPAEILSGAKPGSAGNGQGSERLCAGEITVDLIGNRAYRSGQPLELTAAEYRLLCLLLKNAGRVLTRNAILDALWDGNGNFVDDNTLSVYIRRLREKVEDDPSSPEYLVTVRGFGYQWKTD